MQAWSHAPLHKFSEKRTFMVTSGTLHKEHIFKSNAELDFLQNNLLSLAKKYDWHLEAWAIFSNHYHFLAQSPENPQSLRKFITHFHASTAKFINLQHGTPGRKVWFQYWDSKITYPASYLVRLHYVMNNPVKHKLVNCPTLYPWCSTSWFLENSTTGQQKTVFSTKLDKVHIIDDF